MMIERHAERSVRQRLTQSPAVQLLGPRQVGKTTLARAVAAQHPDALLLDLERESDRAAISQPALFFASHRDRLVVLDEMQYAWRQDFIRSFLQPWRSDSPPRSSRPKASGKRSRILGSSVPTSSRRSSEGIRWRSRWRWFRSVRSGSC